MNAVLEGLDAATGITDVIVVFAAAVAEGAYKPWSKRGSSVVRIGFVGLQGVDSMGSMSDFESG